MLYNTSICIYNYFGNIWLTFVDNENAFKKEKSPFVLEFASPAVKYDVYFASPVEKN